MNKDKTPNPSAPLQKISDAAKIAGLSQYYLRKGVKAGTIPHVRSGQTAMLNDTQMGQLFRAMLQFNRGAEPSLSDPLVSLAFSFVRDSMERDAQKYAATCEKRKAAGAKGGWPKKQKVSSEPDFFNPESKRFSENPDSVPVPVTQSMGVSGGTQTQTGTPDGENTRDFLDSVAYFSKCGLPLNRANKHVLARWVREVGFDVVVMAVDRAMLHGAKTAGYVFTILEEWRSLGLHDVEAVEGHLEGEVVARQTKSGAGFATGRRGPTV